MADVTFIPVMHPDPAVYNGQQAYHKLKEMLHSGRMPHALLFTGIEGCGKWTAAKSLAMAVNCAHRDEIMQGQNHIVPCGECRSCGKTISGNHPDIHLLEPAGQYILIDAIRNLCRSAAMKPYESRMRVAIIRNAHAMNVQAANALLKMLEEPPEATMFILTVIRISDVLPTILSRCRVVRFQPIPVTILQSRLMASNGLSPEDAKIAAILADGSFSQARELSDPGRISRWKTYRQWLIESLGLDRLGINQRQPERLSVATILALAERLVSDKQVLMEMLAMMKTWFRDILICRYHPNALIHADMRDTLMHISRQMTEEWVLSRIGMIEKAEHKLRTNASARLVMEALLLRLQDYLPESGRPVHGIGPSAS